MSIKGAATGIVKGLANAATAKQRLAIKGASSLLKAAGIDNKVTKGMDKIAKGFKDGGKVSRYGMKHGGKMSKEMPKGKPC